MNKNKDIIQREKQGQLMKFIYDNQGLIALIYNSVFYTQTNTWIFGITTSKIKLLIKEPSFCISQIVK